MIPKSSYSSIEIDKTEYKYKEFFEYYKISIKKDRYYLGDDNLIDFDNNYNKIIRECNKKQYITLNDIILKRDKDNNLLVKLLYKYYKQGYFPGVTDYRIEDMVLLLFEDLNGDEIISIFKRFESKELYDNLNENCMYEM